MLFGKYSKSFKDATHALPDGMHMNADYPFMLPIIINKTSSSVTLTGRGGKKITANIKRYRGKEFCIIEQKSSFEKMFGGKPAKFRCFPFIDEKTIEYLEKII